MSITNTSPYEIPGPGTSLSTSGYLRITSLGKRRRSSSDSPPDLASLGSFLATSLWTWYFSHLWVKVLVYHTGNCYGSAICIIYRYHVSLRLSRDVLL